MYELKNYKTEAGNKTVIVGPAGRKYLPVLFMDGGLKVVKVPKTEEQYMTEIIQNGRLKSMKTSLQTFRHYGRTSGTSKAAKKFLRKATKAV